MASKFVMFFDDGEIRAGKYEAIEGFSPIKGFGELLNTFSKGKPYSMVIEEEVFTNPPTYGHILIVDSRCVTPYITWSSLEDLYSLNRPDLEENLKIAKALFLITP